MATEMVTNLALEEAIASAKWTKDTYRMEELKKVLILFSIEYPQVEEQLSTRQKILISKQTKTMKICL